MSGVSYSLPFVVGDGIMLACVYLFDFQNANTATSSSSNVFISWLNQIGGLAVGYIFPIMGAYIACSIADRPRLLTSIVAGALIADDGPSFLGAAINGFTVGYITLGLKKLTAGIPRSSGEIKTLLLFPMLGLTLTSLAMLAINSVVTPVSNAPTDFLSGLSGTNATLLGTVVDGMLTLDLGGPISKTVYLFFVAALTAVDGGAAPPVVMVSCGYSAMVTITSCAVACTLFPKKFSEDLQGVKIAVYITELSFFVEGVILFVADRSKKILPSLCVGVAVTGALVAMFGITLSTPTGDLGTLLLVSNIPSYLLSFTAGIVIAVCMIYFFIRNEPDQG